MNFIMENWYMLIAAIAVIILVVYIIVKFFKYPFSEQLAKVKEWLLWAVTLAERELGNGTGRLKLSMVYDMFIAKFPWTAKLLSFSMFSSLVDSALEVMRKLLEDNRDIEIFVYGE